MNIRPLSRAREAAVVAHLEPSSGGSRRCRSATEAQLFHAAKEPSTRRLRDAKGQQNSSMF